MYRSENVVAMLFDHVCGHMKLHLRIIELHIVRQYTCEHFQKEDQDRVTSL